MVGAANGRIIGSRAGPGWWVVRLEDVAMVMPFLESPYPVPDSDMFSPPAIGGVGALTGPSGLTRLNLDAPHGDALAWRYWAALQAGALSRARLTGPQLPAAAGPPSVVIAQADSLRLHHEAPLENPFAHLLHP